MVAPDPEYCIVRFFYKIFFNDFNCLCLTGSDLVLGTPLFYPFWDVDVVYSLHCQILFFLFFLAFNQLSFIQGGNGLEREIVEEKIKIIRKFFFRQVIAENGIFHAYVIFHSC